MRIIRRSYKASFYHGTERRSQDRQLIMRRTIADASTADKWHQRRFLLKWDINAYSPRSSGNGNFLWRSHDDCDSRTGLMDRASTIAMHSTRSRSFSYFRKGKKYALWMAGNRCRSWLNGNNRTIAWPTFPRFNYVWRHRLVNFNWKSNEMYIWFVLWKAMNWNSSIISTTRM